MEPEEVLATQGVENAPVQHGKLHLDAVHVVQQLRAVWTQHLLIVGHQTQLLRHYLVQLVVQLHLGGGCEAMQLSAIHHDLVAHKAMSHFLTPLGVSVVLQVQFLQLQEFLKNCGLNIYQFILSHSLLIQQFPNI